MNTWGQRTEARFNVLCVATRNQEEATILESLQFSLDIAAGHTIKEETPQNRTSVLFSDQIPHLEPLNSVLFLEKTNDMPVIFNFRYCYYYAGDYSCGQHYQNVACWGLAREYLPHDKHLFSIRR